MGNKISDLIDNPSIAGRANRYEIITLDVAKALTSWRQSLMAHEWLTPEGALRDLDHLNMLDRDKVLKAQKSIEMGEPLLRPVCGIGIFDNVEIGSGRDVFFALARAGQTTVSVHIPLSNRAEFNRYLA